MQLTVKFKGDRVTLPIATGETIQGLIYRALGEDSKYSTLIHDSGTVLNGRKFKLFTFGEINGKYEIEEKNIVYLSDMQLEIRSADPYFIQILLMYFSSRDHIQLGNNRVEVLDVKLGNNVILGNEIAVRTASPITVYITDADRHTVYFSPENEEFYKLIYSNARRKWISHYGSDNGFELSIQNLDGARTVKRATRFKSTYIVAWHGKFLLKGSERALEFLYNVGLGSKNSEGFGMFNIIETFK